MFLPHGTNSVFQAWAVERDLFYALFYRMFGIGPWLQWYYLLSIIITLGGATVILRGEFGLVRAALAAIVVTFFNFFALHKYPGHYNLIILHWTVLGILCDFVIFRGYILRGTVRLSWVLLTVLLLLLCLGHDLGYVAGYSLSSFSLVWLFILVREVASSRKRNLSRIVVVDRPCRTALPFLVVGLMVVTYLYVPIATQIFLNAREFKGVAQGDLILFPGRLIIPYLPFFNPASEVVNELLFFDYPENLGGGSPGLTFVIVAVAGLLKARRERRLKISAHFLVLFLLCLFYVPGYFPSLKLFPWFRFNRVAARSTLIYPVLLTIFSLELSLAKYRWSKGKKIMIVIVGLLAVIEPATAYSLRKDYTHTILSTQFYDYMDRVKEERGVAILDWPFCAIGGNGVGQELCPFYMRNNQIYAYSRFHGKKVMGEYFGRLTLSQIEPYLDAGWSKLFVPDVRDLVKASRQTRCFTDREWRFFEDFFALNDFAGINLYTDLLPPECPESFHRRFGTPVTQTTVPGAGTVQFIPKTEALRKKQNAQEGLLCSLVPPLKQRAYNLLDEKQAEDFVLYGLRRESSTGQLCGTFPLSRISFRLPEQGLVRLSLKGVNEFPGQSITIAFNGTDAEKLEDLQGPSLFEKEIVFRGRRGLNILTLEYGKQPRFYHLLLQDTRRLLDPARYREVFSAARQGIGTGVRYEEVRISLSLPLHSLR